LTFIELLKGSGEGDSRQQSVDVGPHDVNFMEKLGELKEEEDPLLK
jgi:hypothetical protein